MLLAVKSLFVLLLVLGVIPAYIVLGIRDRTFGHSVPCPFGQGYYITTTDTKRKNIKCFAGFLSAAKQADRIHCWEKQKMTLFADDSEEKKLNEPWEVKGDGICSGIS